MWFNGYWEEVINVAKEDFILLAFVLYIIPELCRSTYRSCRYWLSTWAIDTSCTINCSKCVQIESISEVAHEIIHRTFSWRWSRSRLKFSPLIAIPSFYSPHLVDEFTHFHFFLFVLIEQWIRFIAQESSVFGFGNVAWGWSARGSRIKWFWLVNPVFAARESSVFGSWI